VKIYDILPEGQKNAVPRRDLIAITGLSDRTLRSQIAAERRAGALILSCTDNGGGYFRAEPGNAEELRRYIRSMTRRGCETFAALSAAKAALEEMEGAAGGGGTGGGE
jgi:hypothetical protein